ncbi:MAG: NUDIX hydrolase [Acidobacteriota bacterium]|nr:NUDIX hydrolase [Acidobacteriota bacterium]
MKKAELVESRQIFDGGVVRLSVDRIRLPNGNETELEIIRHRGAAAVVPVDSDGNVLLVRQYRYATGSWLLEIPAGKLDGGESPESCARREVEEETGYRPGRLIPTGWIWTTPGFTDEKIWLFVATDLTPTRQDLEDHEVLTVERMPLSEAVALALSGEIVDGKSVCGLARAAAWWGSDCGRAL